MNIHEIILFILFSAPLFWSPGPVNILLAGSGANHGIVKNLPLLFGVTFAVALIAIAFLVGYQLILQNPVVHQWTSIAGAMYIMYLAVKLYRMQPSVSGGQSSPHNVIDGFFATALNPKFYVMLTTVFAQFLSAQKNNALAVLTAFCLFLFCANFGWLCFGKIIGEIGEENHYILVVNKILGSLLFLFTLYFLYLGINGL